MATGAGAIRAGAAFVELFVQDNALVRGLDQAKRRFEGWAQSLKSTGAKLGVAGAGFLAPLAASLKEAAGYGADVQQLRNRLGGTTESLSSLAYAAERVGVPFEQFGATLGGLNDKIVEAAAANKFLNEEMRGLGTGRQLLALPPDERLARIADYLGSIQDAGVRAFAANQLGVSDLLPLLDSGREKLKAMQQEAERAGAVISPEQAARSKQLMDGLTAGWQALKYAVIEVGSALIPSGETLSTYIAKFKAGVSSVREWISEHQELVQTAAAVGAGLVAAGVALTGAGLAAGAMASAVGGLVAGITAVGGVAGTVFGALSSAATALLNPYTLLTAAVGGLAYVFQDELGAAVNWLSDTWDSVVGGMIDLWQNYRAEILAAAGVVALALSPILAPYAAAAAAISGLIALFGTDTGREWLDALGQDLSRLADAASEAWGELKSGLSDAGDEIGQQWSLISEGVRAALSAAAEAIQEAWQPVRGVINAAADAIAGNFTPSMGAVGDAANNALARFRDLFTLGSGFGQLADTVRSAWGGVVEAFQKGDIKTAGEIAFAGLKAAWADAVVLFTERWNAFKALFVDGWADSVRAARHLWNDLAGGIEQVFLSILAELKRQFGETIKAMFDTAAEAAHAVGLDSIAGKLTRVGALSPDDVERKREAAKDRQKQRGAAIDEDHARRQRERDQARKDDVAGAKAAADEARRGLADLIDAAKVEYGGLLNRIGQQAKKAAGGGGGGGNPFRFTIGESVKGMFNGPFSQSLAYGDTVAKSQLNALNGINQNTGVLPDMAKGLNALGQQMKFK